MNGYDVKMKVRRGAGEWIMVLRVKDRKVMVDGKEFRLVDMVRRMLMQGAASFNFKLKENIKKDLER